MHVRLSLGSLYDVICNWEPPTRAHCSNCLYAKVSGSPERPMVTCAQGRGRQMELWGLIRSQRPRQFLAAEKCPDYEGMDS